MIRRKNQNKDIDHSLNNITLPQKQNNHKFNYRVTHFNQDNQSVLNRTAFTHITKQQNQHQIKQQNNKENCREAKRDDALLRRNYDYQLQFSTYDNYDIKKHTKCQSDLRGDKFNFRNVSKSPLKQHSNNQSHLLKMEDNTARKFDHVSFRQKKQLLRTSRNNLVQNKVIVGEDDLQAKYQELWNYNQDIKNKSFRVQNKQQYQSAPFSNYRPQNLIVNARGRFDVAKEQHMQLREYSSIKKHRNDSAHSQISHRNDSASFIKERLSQDHCKTKKTSPQKKYQQGYPHIYANQQKLLRTPHQLQFHLPQSLPLGDEQYYQRDTDAKMKIVEDFSSKISLRIKQLKVSMQQMRLGRK